MGKLLPKEPRAPPRAMVPLPRCRGARARALFEGALSSKRQGNGALCYLEGATAPNPHDEDHESRSSPRLVEFHVTPGHEF
ncbi:hypothetical protein H5410_046743 [Solanum commersonii]|uniref:Uncharacterized protein n=1 Tax=Solanum commersonii TaxID=4109 RepID=A0A9J5XF52_SOLCO|nr:hypothetical protein H5410_046743 [Solanum commersonii]